MRPTPRPGRAVRLQREAVRAVGRLGRLLARAPEPGPGDAFWGAIWREAADAAGAELRELGGGFLELRRGEAATVVQGSLVMLDDPVTLRLAGDKAVAQRRLAEAGLPTARFAPFAFPDFETAERFAGELPGACVVKPARGTGAGRGVTVGVTTRRGLRRAAYHAAQHGRELIVEEQIAGDVLRLLYLEGELLDAVRRRPPEVVGDGRRTLRALIEAENRRRRARGGADALGLIETDPDCRAALARSGLGLGSVPATGRRVPVKGISNAGGLQESESVRDRVGKELAAEGARAAAALGVALAGVDVITPDPARSLHAAGGVVAEVNTTPGLNWHYLVRNPERGVRVALPLLERLLAPSTPRRERPIGPGWNVRPEPGGGSGAPSRRSSASGSDSG